MRSAFVVSLLALLVGLGAIAAVGFVLVSRSPTSGFSLSPQPTEQPSATPPQPASVQVARVTIVAGASIPNSERNFVCLTCRDPKVVVAVIGLNNTVEWVNDEGVPHTVTSDAHGGFNKPTPDSQFDQAAGNQNWLFEQGKTWRFTFTVPGTYTYHCAPHPWMTGTVIVKAR